MIMKKIILTFALLLIATASFAVDLDTIEFYNRDLIEQKVFFCNSQRLNTLTLSVDMFHVGEINPAYLPTVDSVVFSGDPIVFSFPVEWKHLQSLFDFPLVSAVVYHPVRIGDDTVTMKAYYRGKICPGYMICHAVASPTVSLSGIIFDSIYSISGPYYVLENHQEKMFRFDDVFIGDIYNATYYQSNTPKPTGPNKNVVLYSCSGAVIDSIIPVGDFTSFHFTGGLPSVPHTIAPEDSLVIPYTFIPKVNPNKTHYLKFVTHEGQTLIWNFVFDVIAELDVANKQIRTNNYSIFPNPATSLITITSDDSLQGEVEATVVDALGRSVLHRQFTDRQSGNTIDVSLLPAGSYTLGISTACHFHPYHIVITK
jgi:hypothetical protein